MDFECANGMRIVLSVRTNGNETPLDGAQRDQFCAYARSAVESFPAINDVVIGNEPNSSFFWRPQYKLRAGKDCTGLE